MIVSTLILCVSLLLATFLLARTHNELAGVTQDYIDLDEETDAFSEASGYLTEQVRLYVETMDVQHVELYFEEINVTRRREMVLEELKNFRTDSALDVHLEEAIRISNQLMQREIYAIKLVAVAGERDMSALPALVRLARLDAEDIVLEKAAMLEKARTMVFDDEYQAAKDEINAHLSHFTQGVVAMTETQMVDGLGRLYHNILTQRVLLAVLVTINLLTFIVITLLVIKPLRVFLECIKKQSPFQVTGAYEFKYLARVYNDIYQQNKDSADRETALLHTADHDPLTGLLNRRAFDRLTAMLAETRNPVALLLIDVDEFKQINDQYGHVVGDRVLEKVAALLEQHFRAKDYLFRPGGDEFSGIVVDLTASQAHVIEEKVQQINAVLQHPEDDLPPVSLSVGAAFSDSGYHEALYEQADQALYRVKEQGRRGFQAYSDAASPSEALQ